MNESWLNLKMPCRILTRSGSAAARLHKLSKRFYADGIDPIEYKCTQCGCSWDEAVLTDYREVTCSNCYSERVLLVAVRLTFHDWGEQNGGKKKQRDRYEHALKFAQPPWARKGCGR